MLVRKMYLQYIDIDDCGTVVLGLDNKGHVCTSGWACQRSAISGQQSTVNQQPGRLEADLQGQQVGGFSHPFYD